MREERRCGVRMLLLPPSLSDGGAAGLAARDENSDVGGDTVAPRRHEGDGSGMGGM